MGAGGLLVHHRGVEVEAEDAAAQLRAVPPEDMAALELRAGVVVALLGHVRREAGLHLGPAGQAQGDGGAAAAVAPPGEADRSVRLRRELVDDLDDAHEGGGAVHHGRRPPLDLDALHVLQVQGGERRVEGAAPGHAIHHQQEGVELLQAPELGDAGGRPAVAAGDEVDACRQGQGTAEVRGAAVGQILRGEHGDGGRHLDRILGEAGGGDLHRGGTGRLGRVGVLGPQGQGRARHEQGGDQDQGRRGLHGVSWGNERRCRFRRRPAGGTATPGAAGNCPP